MCKEAPRDPRLLRYWTLQEGIGLLPYLDDVLLYGVGKLWTANMVQEVLSVLQALGLKIKHDKCTLSPVQKLVHLGIGINCIDQAFFVPPLALQTVQALTKTVQLENKNPRGFKARLLARLLGKVQSLYLAVPFIRFFQVQLHRCLATKATWNSRVKIEGAALDELHFWRLFPDRYRSQPLQPPSPSAVLETDASLGGFGAVCSIDTADPLFSCGFWDAHHKRMHINILEMQALVEAVQLWGQQLQYRHVRVLTDSMVVYCLLKKFSNTTSELWCRLVKLHKL